MGAQGALFGDRRTGGAWRGAAAGIALNCPLVGGGRGHWIFIRRGGGGTGGAGASLALFWGRGFGGDSSELASGGAAGEEGVWGFPLGRSSERRRGGGRTVRASLQFDN